jgi:hypothetical protein
MIKGKGNEVSDIIDNRVKVAFLQQQLSDLLHLSYGALTWIMAIVPPELEPKLAQVIRAKILQMPQGAPLGQRLIELDEQNGGLLESKGIHLSRWVYEPRENPHASPGEPRGSQEQGASTEIAFAS